MPRIEKSGYRRYWELKEHVGFNPDGSKKSVEGFRDMLTGQFHAPKGGWSGRPPELPSGDREPIITDKYKHNYDNILWER